LTKIHTKFTEVQNRQQGKDFTIIQACTISMGLCQNKAIQIIGISRFWMFF